MESRQEEISIVDPESGEIKMSCVKSMWWQPGWEKIAFQKQSLFETALDVSWKGNLRKVSAFLKSGEHYPGDITQGYDMSVSTEEIKVICTKCNARRTTLAGWGRRSHNFNTYRFNKC